MLSTKQLRFVLIKRYFLHRDTLYSLPVRTNRKSFSLKKKKVKMRIFGWSNNRKDCRQTRVEITNEYIFLRGRDVYFHLHLLAETCRKDLLHELVICRKKSSVSLHKQTSILYDFLFEIICSSWSLYAIRFDTHLLRVPVSNSNSVGIIIEHFIQSTGVDFLLLHFSVISRIILLSLQLPDIT